MSLLNEWLPVGQVVDEGDTILQTRRLVKGRHPRFMLRDGAERDTTPTDRVPNSTPAVPAHGGIPMAQARDLPQDKKFTRTYAPVDEFGAPASTPFVGTQVFSTDRPDLVNLADDGAGSCVVAAVGGIDPTAVNVAVVTFTATPDSGAPVFVDNGIVNVTTGGAEGFAATDSADEEVTPDTP